MTEDKGTKFLMWEREVKKRKQFAFVAKIHGSSPERYYVIACGETLVPDMELSDAEYTSKKLNDVHDRRIKAERERCAKIAEKEVVLDIASLESGEFYSNSAGRIIAEKIRGGQDGD